MFYYMYREKTVLAVEHQFQRDQRYMDRLAYTHSILSDLLPSNFPSLLEAIGQENSELGRAYTIRERIFPVHIKQEDLQIPINDLIQSVNELNLRIELDVQPSNFIFGVKSDQADPTLYYIDKVPSWCLLRLPE